MLLYIHIIKLIGLYPFNVNILYNPIIIRRINQLKSISIQFKSKLSHKNCIPIVPFTSTIFKSPRNKSSILLKRISYLPT